MENKQTVDFYGIYNPPKSWTDRYGKETVTQVFENADEFDMTEFGIAWNAICAEQETYAQNITEEELAKDPYYAVICRTMDALETGICEIIGKMVSDAESRAFLAKEQQQERLEKARRELADAKAKDLSEW